MDADDILPHILTNLPTLLHCHTVEGESDSGSGAGTSRVREKKKHFRHPTVIGVAIGAVFLVLTNMTVGKIILKRKERKSSLSSEQGLTANPAHEIYSDVVLVWFSGLD
jgi:hypothetical protein